MSNHQVKDVNYPSANAELHLGMNSLKARKRTSADRLKYITHNIIEAYMYHYAGQHTPNGQVVQFIRNRGIQLNTFYKWKPIVFEILTEELYTYQPH